MTIRTHVYRLYPTQAQNETFSQWIGCVRLVYNLGLEQRRTFYRPGRAFNFATQCRELTDLRAQFDWLREVPIYPLQQALRDLHKAYQNWWSGRSGAPTPRRRLTNDSMRFSDPRVFSLRRLSRHIGVVKIPKLGFVEFRWDKKISGTPKNITVQRKAEIWTLAVQYEFEATTPERSSLPSVGIDRGIAVFAALSDGTLIAPANHGSAHKKRLARAQQSLSRKKKGSKNRAKQRLRVAKIYARIARCRKDFLHKRSTDIAKTYGLVAIEKLEIRNMTRSAKGTKAKPGRRVRQKSGLNHSIFDQGWGMFGELLQFKLKDRGASLIKIPAHNTSRTCSGCGAIDAASRRERTFLCTSCGYTTHADVNAAINILRRADSASLPVEAVDCHAREAGTIRGAA